MKSCKFICLLSVLVFSCFQFFISDAHAENIPTLKVIDARGIVSYINPVDGKPHVFFGATDAWIQLRKISTAVSSEDFVKIPSSDSSMVGDMNVRKNYAGHFIFSLTDQLPLWFVSPHDLKRYYFDGTESSYQFLIKMNAEPINNPSKPQPPVISTKVGIQQNQLDLRVKPEDDKKVQLVTTSTAMAKKNIVINLATQELQQREGDQVIATYKVSTGKASTPTPRGTFKITWKHPRAWSRSASLWMPYFMKFNNAGAGIHELPEWPSGKKEGEKDLGRRVSHGCVRLGIGAAKILYDWAPVGTPITIVAR